MYKLETLNITLKAYDHNVIGLQSFLEEHFKDVVVKVLPDTTDLYENDPHFKRLVKEEKKAKRLKLDYIHSKK